MKYNTKLITIIIGLIFSFQAGFAQELNFEKYQQFLNDNSGLTSEGLYSKYPVGEYRQSVNGDNTGICFYDSVNVKYALTAYEQSLIDQHDFMVSERLSFTNFWEAYEDIFHKDLPVFISTDALLHALHMSYDAMLKDIEQYILIPKLSDLLKKMHAYIPVLAEKYNDSPEMKNMILDCDVYFTIARDLLQSEHIVPIYSENTDVVNDILDMINSETAVEYPLFAETKRSLDFSQFTVRGHYTDSPDLGRYFKSMIWLGRTELYLIAPKTVVNEPSPEDVQRQIIDALLILEAAEKTGMDAELDKIDNMIKALVGESDNVKVNHLKELMEETNFQTIDLLDMEKVGLFQETLADKSYADQKILSQILWTDPFNTEKIKPASAFMLFGQRFIIDSYITGSVVFDKIDAKRMLPSCHDVLFALGNNAASDFLKPELDEYDYAKNIAALRYLVDSYDNDYWNSSVYNTWLNTIRSLNSPSDETRTHMPAFMQTAAWWQEKMNTQLASWAQLRHDNLLYAKQSYTGGVSCSNPDAYLEPIPEFYQALGNLAVIGKEKITANLDVEDNSQAEWIKMKTEQYFDNLETVSQQLYDIAVKEANGTELTEDEILFLRSVYSWDIVGCGEYDHQGWYSDMFYFEDDDVEKADFVVADVHTAPTDEYGAMVGWVWHVGTGNVNLAVITTENSYGEKTAYVGPVMSYHEHVSMNFKRLTDEEWEEMYDTPDASRPEFTDLYLADKDGNPRNDYPYSLPLAATAVEENTHETEIGVNSYPNPFSDYITISFRVPSAISLNNVNIAIYSAGGDMVNNIFSGSLPARNFTMRWNGTDNSGKNVPAGTYICKIEAGGKIFSAKMVYSK